MTEPKPRTWINMEIEIGAWSFEIFTEEDGSVAYQVMLYETLREDDEDIPNMIAQATVGREDFLAMLTLARTEKELAIMEHAAEERP